MDTMDDPFAAFNAHLGGFHAHHHHPGAPRVNMPFRSHSFNIGGGGRPGESKDFLENCLDYIVQRLPKNSSEQCFALS